MGSAPHPRELLKLGIKISQATVGRWMPWRPKVPSPSWRSFLRNHLPDIAAIDMFVVATVTFRLLYTLIVLNLDRRRVVHFEVTPNPTQDWLSGQMTEAFPWDTAPRYSAAGPGQIIWPSIPSSRSRDGDHRGHHCPAIALAEPICRAIDRFDPPRMPGSRHYPQRASLAPRAVELFSVSP